MIADTGGSRGVLPKPPGDYGIAAAAAEHDWDAVARILQRYALEFPSLTESMQAANAALRSMPVSEREARPGILPHLQLLGLAPITDDTSFILDVDRLCGGGEESALELRSLTVAIMAFRFRQRLDLAMRLVETATPHVASMPLSFGDETETVAAAYFVQAANTCLLAGAFGHGQNMLAHAWHWRYRDILGFVGHETAVKIAAVSASSGDLREAELWLGEARAWPTECNNQTKTVVMFAGPLAEFIIASDRLDFARTEEILPRLAHPTHSFEFLQWVIHARVHRLLLLGRAADALRLLDEVAPLINGVNRRYLNHSRAVVFLAAGRIDEALELLDTMPDDDATSLHRARAMAMKSDNTGAITMLDAMSKSPVRRLDLAARALRASCLLRLGRREAAREAFNGLLDMIDTNFATIATIDRDTAHALFALCRNHPNAEAVAEKWSSRTRVAAYPFAHSSPQSNVELTDREYVMLRYLSEGLSRPAIARRETVSINTVKSQLTSLYKKLHAANAKEAVVNAQELGWLKR